MTRRYVMCRPTHFEVRYAINPWMHLDDPVDHGEALRQWESLRSTLERLGHTVDVIDPPAALPDLVFVANAGVELDGVGLGARFRHPERQPEEPVYREALAAIGITLDVPRSVNEGSGDVLVVPGSHRGAGRALAGYGPRTDRDAHAELAEHLGIEVVSLRLVDERYYHLDTACSLLDERTVVYVPTAFDAESAERLRSLFDRHVELTADDAAVLGANVVSDGTNVIVSDRVTALPLALRDLGFEPIPVALGEFLKSGGGPHCCVLEVSASS